jgi:hypothetical protein
VLQNSPSSKKPNKAPLHAWRALVQLQAEASVVPLLAFLKMAEGDEAVGQDFPMVFGMIGPAAIPLIAASATFWIEWVRNPGEPPIPLGPGQPSPPIIGLEPFWDQSTHLQLQYSQLVILIFNNVLWPHVTVATMTLSAG